jgi:hypothetical protein
MLCQLRFAFMCVLACLLACVRADSCLLHARACSSMGPREGACTALVAAHRADTRPHTAQNHCSTSSGSSKQTHRGFTTPEFHMPPLPAVCGDQRWQCCYRPRANGVVHATTNTDRETHPYTHTHTYVQ